MRVAGNVSVGIIAPFALTTSPQRIAVPVVFLQRNMSPLFAETATDSRPAPTDSPPMASIDPTPLPHRIVIQGVTLAGRAFRPSDWADRLCGIMSSFGGDNQMRYSPHVRPMRLDGVTCVVVEPKLKDIEPRAYRFLLDFANDNELVVIDPMLPSTDEFCPVPGNALESLSRD